VLKEKVPDLLAAWETARTIMSPSFTLLSAELDDLSQLEKLSLLSSRQEYWDCAVCALGFAETNSIAVNDLLTDTANDIKTNMLGGRTREFLNYCREVSSVDAESLLAAARVISNVINIGTLDPKFMLDFETCYEVCGDNESCMRSCLASKGRNVWKEGINSRSGVTSGES
jgi:hypothetical protein